MTHKPLVLAVETSSRVGSVALATGEQLLAEIIFSGTMRHSAELFPAVITLLKRFDRKPEDIEQVYISVGPGSFTGMRIAVTLAKAMHLAGSVKVVSVNTLDAIAANVIGLRSTSIETIVPILDAKRGYFYVAAYQKQKGICHKDTILPGEGDISFLHKQKSAQEPPTTGNEVWKKILPDSLMTVSKFQEKFACREKPVWLLGDGLLYHKDKFETEGICFFDEEFWSPRASKVHQLGREKALAGEFADPLTLTPNYLMRPEVTLKGK